ncbi:MAG: glycosyl hydrolase family 57, partial [Gemmataceae bacterium]
MDFTPLAEMIGDLPNLCGAEDRVEAVMRGRQPVFLPETNLHVDRLRAVFAIALHMQQPLVPAGGPDLRTAAMIGNLDAMMRNPGLGDNHNAPLFAECYARMGDLIPEQVQAGRNPRVMLDYSGELLFGLRKMGRGDVLDRLKRITCDPHYRKYVEWLGTMWGHAVASSTPPADLKLHIRAWQQNFAALFGWDALTRVRGFSPPEMHLPNHPD